MRDKLRSIAMRLAFEIPIACVIAIFLASILAEVLAAVSWTVEYYIHDVGHYVFWIGTPISVALIVLGRPKLVELAAWLITMSFFAPMFFLLAYAQI